ncbi:metal ABC transporter ATP-binding protein [Thalassobacillus pellis]|uniref:metal ABC transporter ATP-binding protein n=1 Tax=Thalassobacillus pellis TaxID=748008 RepID=UPI00196116A8|nr:metal ABC transporter ATP-binding protein [Thalassobacillus pellis]MBM7553701.1 zinc transport system ATP-binding protein [Thalassobacillus pellis]
MNAKTILEMSDVSFKYDKETVVQNVSLSIKEGEFLGLVGPNGSGKSTLIKLMLGLLKPTAGKISLFDQPIRSFKQWEDIGFVSQKANSFNSGFPATVLEVVKMGRVSKTGMFRFFTRRDKEQSIEALKTVEMEDYLHHNIGELSGGQQQRVFIARALVSEPKFLILDEPTVGVDARHVADFYDLLEKLNKEKGITLLMVSHDIGTITEHASHVVCMNKTIHFHGHSEEYKAFSDDDLNRLYGHAVQQLTHNHHNGEAGEL